MTKSDKSSIIARNLFDGEKMEKIIEIKNLSKSFGDVKAVNNISFSVEKGSLFSFLGVNGAGKSTTISMLCGLLAPDSGTINVCGQSCEKVKDKIGVVFQSSVLDAPLSVYDNLKYRASFYGITGEKFKKRLVELSKILDMGEILNRPVAKLSGGQRRKADIARALFHSPSLLVLDEPTTGLDPQTRKLLWQVIEELRKKEGLTVLLTTHYMEEASESDRIVIIDSGEIIAEGTPLELKNKYTKDTVTLYGVTENEVKKLGLPYVFCESCCKIFIEDTSYAAELILNHRELFSDFEITKGKMDDVFLAVTGKELSGGGAK